MLLAWLLAHVVGCCSALCSCRSESFRRFLFRVVVLVVLLLLVSRGCPPFLAKWGFPTWLFASSQPTRDRDTPARRMLKS